MPKLQPPDIDQKPVPERRLSHFLEGYKDAVIIGLGNEIRRDDGVGVYITSHLKGSKSFKLFNAGISAENYTGPINRIKPGLVLIIDATHMLMEAGSFRLIPMEELSCCTTNTHNFSLKKSFDFNFICDVYLLGIQPWNTSFGIGLSEPVSKTANQLIHLIQQRINQEI